MSDFRVGDSVRAKSFALTIEKGVVTHVSNYVYVDDYPFLRCRLRLLKKGGIGQPQYKDHLIKCDLSTQSFSIDIVTVNKFIKNMIDQEN